jgi:hypothetical protein
MKSTHLAFLLSNFRLVFQSSKTITQMKIKNFIFFSSLILRQAEAACRENLDKFCQLWLFNFSTEEDMRTYVFCKMLSVVGFTLYVNL